MKTLVLTVGLPRSGKSTWAKAQGYPVVNRDAIRLALHGCRFRSEAEEMVSVLEKNMVLALFYAGHDIVIVDATHNTEKRRAPWQRLQYRINPFEVVYHYVKTSKEECIARAKTKGDEEIIPVIERMAEESDWR